MSLVQYFTFISWLKIHDLLHKAWCSSQCSWRSPTYAFLNSAIFLPGQLISVVHWITKNSSLICLARNLVFQSLPDLFMCIPWGVVFPNEAHIINLHTLEGLHNLIQLPIENFSLRINARKNASWNKQAHTHHEDICTSSVYSKPS